MEKRHFTENQKKLIGGVAIVIFVVFSAAICWFVGKPMVKFVSEPEKFRMWVDSHGLWSQVAYVGDGIKDCSGCLVPHGRGSYSYITKKFPELAELARKKDTK